MKLWKIYFLLVTLVGCVQQPISQQQPQTEQISQQEEKRQESKQQINPRVAFLKYQALLSNQKLENFYEVASLFGVMKALQDGKLTTSDLKDALFYFKDPDGYDSGYLYNSTYFKCVQVIEMGGLENDSGEKVPIYQALYTNSQIEMTVTVYWAETRPLQGQKLNVDFLTFYKVGTYKNKKGDDRTEVIFWRPKWAGSNGYSYY